VLEVLKEEMIPHLITFGLEKNTLLIVLKILNMILKILKQTGRLAPIVMKVSQHTLIGVQLGGIRIQ